MFQLWPFGVVLVVSLLLWYLTIMLTYFFSPDEMLFTFEQYKIFQDHLVYFFPSPTGSHFSKNSVFLCVFVSFLFKKGIQNQDQGIRYGYWYCDIIAFGLFLLKKQWNICVHNDLYINIYLYIFLWATTSVYIEWNMSSNWYMWLQSITTWSLLSPLLFIILYSQQRETWLPPSTFYISIAVYSVHSYQNC